MATDRIELHRSNDGWLASPERRILIWLGSRLPAWLTPDCLTAIGFLGAAIVLVAYILSERHPAMLWLASVGLIINWFGDSLDGSVARLRRIERPRYGFFLDQSLDALEQLLVGLGLGLSGYIRLELTVLGVAVYFMMSIVTLLSATTTRVFRLAYGGVGLTELRCMFVALNALIFFLPPRSVQLPGISVTYPNLLALAWIIATLVTYLLTMARELKRLAREDPEQRPLLEPMSSIRSAGRRRRAATDHS